MVEVATVPNYAGVNLVGLGREFEQVVADILRQHGHHIEPPANYHYDLLCDGKVRIEVKVGRRSGKNIAWAFNSRKRLSDYCDIVILIADLGLERRHYILPADHDVFYSNGNPKAGIGFYPDAKRLTKSTGQILEQHYERWDLIGQIRDGHYHHPKQAALF